MNRDEEILRIAAGLLAPPDDVVLPLRMRCAKDHEDHERCERLECAGFLERQRAIRHPWRIGETEWTITEQGRALLEIVDGTRGAPT